MKDKIILLRSTCRCLVIALLVVSTAFPPEVSGAKIEKRVVFKKGKTSAVFTGKMGRFYADYDAYVLGSKGSDDHREIDHNRAWCIVRDL